jgi:CIC family chloride channel protein
MSRRRIVLSVPSGDEAGCQPIQLLKMSGGKCVQLGLPLGGYAQPHDALVEIVVVALDEPSPLGPVDQFDDAVVAKQEVLGHVSDRRRRPVPPNRQQQLVLHGGDADLLGPLLAPVQEPAQPVTQLEQAPEVRIGQLLGFGDHIDLRYYRFTMVTSSKRLLLLTGLAAAIGVAGGGAAWVLLRLIQLITNVALFHEASLSARTLAGLEVGWPLFAAAIAGGMLISILARWAPLIRGHGIPEAMEAVLTKQSRVAPRTAIAKPVSAALAIGTGAPFGAEGPIIVTGASIGSLLGQVIPVSPSERKILLAVGAAAGMSATFGAPLAAVVLAIELLLFEFSARAFIPLVVGAAIAAGMHSALFEAGPLFQVPHNDYAGLSVVPAFVLLGLACGGLAIVVSRGLFMVEQLYRRLPVGDFWHPAIGALGFATVGLFVPRALGVGYDAIGDVLNARLAVGTVAALAIGKLIAWWLALGSGTSGGTLAPILLISASFGTVVGSALNQVLPGADVALGAFAIVAMAATFGAATQATFTAIVFVFELTRDYEVILPLMLATVIADLVYSAVNEDSLMTEKLRRRGLHIGRHYGVDPFTGARVSDIMTISVETLPATATAGEARRRFAGGGHGAYPILDHDRLVGIVTRGDILRDDGPDDDLMLDRAAADVVTVRPGDSAHTVLRVMLDERIEHVPVLDPDGRLVGICTRTDLLKIRRRHHDLEQRQAGLVPRAQRLLKRQPARNQSREESSR